VSESTAAGVAAYLRRNPDFLLRHPDLLRVLAPPGRDESGVVDLQRAMVERERRNNGQLRGVLRQVLDLGENNQTSMTRVHDAALALAGLGRLKDLAAEIAGSWPQRLGCDAAALCFETRAAALPAAPGLAALAPGRVEALAGAGPARLQGGLEGGPPDVFGAAAGQTASYALLRLPPVKASGQGGPAGLLALSSRDPAHFQAGQGTELLVFLARAVAAHLPMLIDPPEAL